MNAQEVSANCDSVSIPANSLGVLASVKGWGWRQRWVSRNAAQLLTVVFSVLLLASVRRTIRLPNSYAKGHWLHNFKHGFVPRGLVGELLYPIMQHKNPEEVNGIIAMLAWGVLAGLCGLMMHGAWRVLDGQKLAWRRCLATAALWVFATSPFVVLSGHLVGYFDHIIQALGLFGIFCLLRKRYVATGVVCALSILVHEIFVLTVMPALFFVTLLTIQGQTRAIKCRALAGLLVLPVLTALAVVLTGTGTNDVAMLTQDIERYGVVDHAGMNTVHISQGFRSILDSMLPTTMVRVMRPDGPRVMWPSLLILLGAGLVFRVRGYGGWLRVIFVLTSLTPMIMLLTVWEPDTSRMASMTQFCAFCSLVGLAGLDRGQINLQPPRVSRRLASALLIAFCIISSVVMIWQLRRHTWLMDYELDGQTLLGKRKPRPAHGYRCDQLLFENSNFEQGSLRSWQSFGQAFNEQPVDRQPNEWYRRPNNEGKYWIGSYDRRALAGRPMVQGDGPKGFLLSQPFVITRSFVNFLVGGGSNVAQTYVSLEVDGRSVYRTAGRQSSQTRTVVWDLRRFYGHSARIRIADQSAVGWGHIIADGFCYVEEPELSKLPQVVSTGASSATDVTPVPATKKAVRTDMGSSTNTRASPFPKAKE